MSKGRAVALDRMQHMVEAAQAIIEYRQRGPTLEGDLPEIEWSLIARMRDRLTHHYWTTDSEVVWSTATTAVPELHRVLAGALRRLL